MNKVAEIISTVFYVGRIPFAPGTICSFLAFLSWYYLRFYIEGVFILYGSLILFFIGVAVSTIYSESIKKEDPPEVVIDEWVGQWIALWLIPHSFAATRSDLDSTIVSQYCSHNSGLWRLLNSVPVRALYVFSHDLQRYRCRPLVVPQR